MLLPAESFVFGIYPGGAAGSDEGIAAGPPDDPARVQLALTSLAGGSAPFIVRVYERFSDATAPSPWPRQSPENYLQYVRDGFYDNTVFHRVINGFMVQGGGFTSQMRQKPTQPTVKNEAGNGLKNERGTLAMARTSVIDSATSQFFINHANNAFLDHQNNTDRGFGYAVFGKVIDGMDVVDKIAAVETTGKGGPSQDMPLKPVEIKSIQRKAAAATK